MKNFRRSLRYLWPYRPRLALAAACVLLIAVLWGGGLAMLLPGAKVLLSREGLHGWAWDRIVQDRLGARVIQRMVAPGLTIAGQPVSLVLDVVEVSKGGPADRAGVPRGNWIVGLGRADPGNPDRLLRADQLARRLAHLPPGEPMELRVHDPLRPGSPPRTVRLLPGRAGVSARLLGRLAGSIPEPSGYAERFPILLYLIAVVLAMTYLRDLLRFIQEYLVQSAVLRGIVDLRSDNYTVALGLPVTFFSEKGVTDTVSRFVQDTAELGRGQATLFGKTLVEPAKALGALGAALLISWKLTLVAMVAGPPAFWLIRRFGRRMRRASRRALESWSGMLGVLEGTLSGIRVVKAYTMEGSERRRFLAVNRRLLKQQRRMARIDSATAPSVEALGLTAGMGAAALAGYAVFHGRMSAEDFLALMACLVAMFDPVRKLAKVATRFQRAEAAAARVFELQDQQQEKRVPNAPALPRHRQSLEFRGVRFRYPQAGEDALKDVSLRISAGETVAIVGPNGSGKTTLVSLVPRLIDPDAGAVLIDGRDVSQHSVRSLRRQIALVTQETVIFHATLADNIAYGLRRPRADRVLAAARQAFVDEFVRELPDGYDTMVGERGATLSGGQRQRIAIARAILRDPAILIFDEATSQIDSHSEQRIQQAMAGFVLGRTTLLIAHRFATIRQADRIAVLDAGRVVDVGAHEDLIERCGLYRQLYEHQFAPEQES